jgi:hypothetical protein
MDIFKVDTIENVGDNWLIADFGVDEDGKHYILTTNRVHASEAYQLGTVKEQIELVCLLLNEYYKSRGKFLRTSPLDMSEFALFVQANKGE